MQLQTETETKFIKKNFFKHRLPVGPQEAPAPQLGKPQFEAGSITS